MPTIEVGLSGEKGTLILPGTYEKYFNKLLDEFNLSGKIKATNHLNMNNNSEIEYLKESINNGLPVTIYAGFINSKYFSEHYFVCYDYVDYVLYHKETKE